MATPTTRRTQEQRRAEMRERLLDATVESLMEDGYAATTLRAVAARADVSSGAMTHHYPRRVDLVGAALERLTEQRLEALRPVVRKLPAQPQARMSALLDLIWTDFSGPLFRVFVKLWIAADDDEELYERLVPLERVMARAITAAVAELAADYPVPDIEARTLTVLATLRGLALSQGFEPRERRPRNQWALVRPMLEQLVFAP
jgi:AcrR family transcriptional regulator